MAYIELIAGENSYAVRKRLRQRLKKLEPPKIIFAEDIKEFSDFGNLNSELDMFRNNNVIVAYDILKQAPKRVIEALYEYCEQEKYQSLSENPAVYLFFIETSKPDKRSRLYKKIKSKFIVDEYAKATSGEIRKFISQRLQEANISILDNTLDKLFQKLEASEQDVVNHELNKIILLSKKNNGVISENNLEVITTSIENQIWDLLTLACHNKSEALQLLENLWEQQIHFSMIIGFLASQFRQLINYYYYPDDLVPFLRNRIGTLAHKINKRKLQYLVAKLADLDFSLKSTKLDPKLGLITFIQII